MPSPILGKQKPSKLIVGGLAALMAIIGIYIVVFSHAASGDTANLWVGAAGSCTRSNSPLEYNAATSCGQLQAAYNKAATGDLVMMIAGNYSSSFSGGAKNPAPIFKSATNESVTIGSIALGTNTGNFVLDGVTFGSISTPQGSSTWNNITIKNSTLSSSAEILLNNCGGNNSGIVFDNDIFKDQNNATFDGRISFVNSSPGVCGAIIKNSLFQGGVRDGIFITNVPYSGIKILNNRFLGMGPNGGSDHTDDVQCVGGCQLTLDHNYFGHSTAGQLQGYGSFDGSSHETITNNVFDLGEGSSFETLTLGSDDSSLIDHNTLATGATCVYSVPCGQINIGHKSGDDASHGTIITNNIAAGIEVDDATSVTVDYNLVPGGISGRGAHNLSGSATYVGPPVGKDTSTFNLMSMYQLTSNSLGHNASNTGTDIGASISSTTPPTCTRAADINCDGSVNIQDVTVVLSNFGKSVAQSSDPRADTSGNGTIDIPDMTVLLSAFGS
jgi:hypothetical protein